MMNDECHAPQPHSLLVYHGKPIILHSSFRIHHYKGRILTPCRIPLPGGCRPARHPMPR
jgi:hypothetical protein